MTITQKPTISFKKAIPRYNKTLKQPQYSHKLVNCILVSCSKVVLFANQNNEETLKRYRQTGLFSEMLLIVGRYTWKCIV